MNNILIESKEWFDRINGNSYFSSRIEIDGELAAVLPFQYGYGSHDVDMATKELKRLEFVNMPKRSWIQEYCRNNKIQFKTIKHEKCLKRDVVA